MTSDEVHNGHYILTGILSHITFSLSVCLSVCLSVSISTISTLSISTPPLLLHFLSHQLHSFIHILFSLSDVEQHRMKSDEVHNGHCMLADGMDGEAGEKWTVRMDRVSISSY